MCILFCAIIMCRVSSLLSFASVCCFVRVSVVSFC